MAMHQRKDALAQFAIAVFAWAIAQRIGAIAERCQARRSLAQRPIHSRRISLRRAGALTTFFAAHP